MESPAPTLMRGEDAKRALRKSLGAGRGSSYTVADAAARSGLALRDAEQGLHALVDEFRGQLRVTADGDLVFVFPYGLHKPWVTATRLQRAAAATGRALEATARFVVRAWIMVVLVGYTAIFLAILVALMFAKASSRDSRSSHRSFGFGPGYLLMRLIGDAFFWTFHPWSPVAIGRHDRGRRAAPRAPRKRADAFYEKVNRFFFGPDRPAPDPREFERRVLGEIRAQKGRIGLADVMRVTGLPRQEADPRMARLMLDYDGTVEVSEEGGIIYRFPELRRTVADRGDRLERPPPVWATPERLPPLTGNDAGTNFVIAGLNGFNLLMSLWVLGEGLTLSNVALLVQGIPLQELPAAGTPVALGLVPLVFSIALFALPIGRALVRPLQARRVARENGRRALLAAVLGGIRKGGVRDEELRRAWRAAAGAEPATAELTREVAALGGDVEIEAEGTFRYRFPDLETEARALEAEREAASEEEARLGQVVYSTED